MFFFNRVEHMREEKKEIGYSQFWKCVFSVKKISLDNQIFVNSTVFERFEWSCCLQLSILILFSTFSTWRNQRKWIFLHRWPICHVNQLRIQGNICKNQTKIINTMNKTQFPRLFTKNRRKVYSTCDCLHLTTMMKRMSL